MPLLRSCLLLAVLLLTGCSREYALAAIQGFVDGATAPVTVTRCARLNSGLYCTTRTF